MITHGANVCYPEEYLLPIVIETVVSGNLYSRVVLNLGHLQFALVPVGMVNVYSLGMSEPNEVSVIAITLWVAYKCLGGKLFLQPGTGRRLSSTINLSRF